MLFLSSGQTDVGRRREHNEDSMLIAPLTPSLGLYAVCDGMGGHASGEVASALAASTLHAFVSQHQAELQAPGDDAQARETLVRLVRTAVLTACKAIYDQGQSHPKYAKMGTTLTMLLHVGEQAVIAHVGDSRLYLLRKGKVFKLTNDHTLATELMFHQVLTPEEAQNDPRSSILLRGLGLQPSVAVDTLLFDILPDDTFLLCSDGLSRAVHQVEEIAQILGQPQLEAIPKALVQLANERDGSDNVSVIVLRSRLPEADPKAVQHSLDVQKRIEILRNVPLFRELSMKEIAQILEITKTLFFHTGDILIREGEQSGQMYIALEGHLSITRGGEELAVLAPGAHVGEMALLEDRPRSATVRAVEPSRALLLEREPFFRLLHKDPALGVKLLITLAKELSSRLDAATQLVLEIAHPTASEP